MVAPGEPHASLRERMLGERGVILLIGGADTGKTTLAKFLLADALGLGVPSAFIDADLAVSTVGPPACVGLKWIEGPEDIADPHAADELRFVGSTSPSGVVLQHVVAVASLVEAARSSAEFVVLDTTGDISGVLGQTISYHLAELCHPALVVALHRGSELAPIVGMLERFLSARIAMADARPPADLPSPLDRLEARVAAFRAAFAEPLQRWRVQPTVFAPTVPEEFDLAKLDGMLVGVQDGSGRCLGLGALEYGDGGLLVVTRHGDAMEGLRLGSMRIDLGTFETSRVRLRQLIFGI